MSLVHGFDVNDKVIHWFQTSPWLTLGLFCIAVLLFRSLWTVIRDYFSQPQVFGDDVSVWPYRRLPIMTNSEVVFFRLLQQAAPEYLIFSQVQLCRIIDAHDDENSGMWLNRINRMSVDYVLVDAADAQTTLVVIELDDWSHESKARQRADAKKDKALSCAGIPIMRFHGEYMPTVLELRKEIMYAVKDARKYLQ